MAASDVPVCLVFAANDPSGGAGLQADIEAMASMGCHAAPVITAVTVQDTENVQAVEPVRVSTVIHQARTILEDMPVAAVKIGLLPDVSTVEAIHSILSDFPVTPVVLDPVIRAGGGSRLIDDETKNAMATLLFPQTTVLTPNGPEARQFSLCTDNLDACGFSLLEAGCEYVLISGGHERDEQVTNTLFGNHRVLERFQWQRLPGEFHGTGCTLASSIAGLLSHGQEPLSAISEAQQYTWEAIRNAYRAGRGQLLPNRFFWASNKRERS
ncbi:MAG: hydroxymethylpyrimidine/phosphomethylpyrimidine kinase [Gammaproteobacteria bacterium]|nr:MAG: hydroxymethylpyrimidine/phosphomethylpyrimidine kinase [Gammaproteobacteria bacterium]